MVRTPVIPRWAGRLVVVAALSSGACGSATGPLVHEHQSIDRGAATSARVDIGMSAGELTVKSGTATLLEGDFDFNVPALRPAIAYSVSGETGTLELSQGSVSGDYENSWRLALDETTPMDLRLSLLAGDANVVVGRLNLQRLAVRLGAGDLTVDLRGMPATSYGATIETGPGDTTIYVPATVGISASLSGLIGDSNVIGLEKRDGRWINTRAIGAPVTIDLTVRHAIGDLRLIAE